MVVDSDDDADRLFHALSDRTRRDIVRRVVGAEQSVSGLARLYPMSTTAVAKHVAILEAAGLVTRRKDGREQKVTARHDGVRRARELLDAYEELWRGRLDRIADLLAADETLPAPHRTAPDEGTRP